MNLTHGMSKTPTYRSWKSMKERCLNGNHKSHDRYKKITICRRWVESFDKFLKDMGERPEGKTLDRIDNKKGYNRKNCRWATRSQQSINRSPYSNTGYKNISNAKHLFKYKDKLTEYEYFHVEIKRGGSVLHKKAFKDINNAIKFRDKALKEIKDEQ